MPRIFDNIETSLLPALRETLKVSDRADFCVGYFNLRGWRQIDGFVDNWSGGEGHCCRLLVGMQRLPQEELRDALRIVKGQEGIDNQTAIRLKKKLAEEFREQLMIGMPTAQDEEGLRRLAAHIREKKVVVKLFLRHPLHAKLYLLFRPDPIAPKVGYLGSSNLTLAGLSNQGELNVDVLDQDACTKLSCWFEDRWDDHFCMDISSELAGIINESWAREKPLPPYHIYLKMAYHLSQEARSGLTEFRIPRDFGNQLFEFQVQAVKIAAHHLNKRGGVLIGDVVGLGKTLMATAVARIFEDDHDLETLIICPKNLVSMWEDYRSQYRMRAKVLSISLVHKELHKLRRYRLIVIDESHNLRNREGKRYRAIQEYIRGNESKVILLSATPYNKTYLDLSNQLRLFIPEDMDIGLRPENLLRDIGEIEFVKRHQCSPRSLAGFEHSPYADDWRELMRLYLVRRTRSFIQDNYALTDPTNGKKYLEFPDGARSYFPIRQPRTIKFKIDEKDPKDQYALLYSTQVVDAINHLMLPRYGLGNYVIERPHEPPTTAEAAIIADLSRAGKRLMGFCRTNLFKRLESSGQAFIQSVERHILRNFVYLHAIETKQPIPIGTQDASLLDDRIQDRDLDLFSDEDDNGSVPSGINNGLRTEADFRKQAAKVYELYAGPLKKRFRWLSKERFSAQLKKDLHADISSLLGVLNRCGAWDPRRDAKLKKLIDLISRSHPGRKLIVFSQFADTVDYLAAQLAAHGIQRLAGVTGDTDDPTKIAWRFSPESNKKRSEIGPLQELDVLISTDVLSEGQNLQDGAVIVNFDLPWAIIRLIQRAGRVDRIGQKADTILCYSFLPAEGVERIIRLRARVRQRLQENAEVVGTDEAFFEDDQNDQAIRDLFTERAGILDGDADTEVDLSSYAYQIWKNAVDKDPSLQKVIPALPNVVYSTKPHVPIQDQPEGALVYVRTAQGNDALAWVNKEGKSITESQFAILKAAECIPETPAVPRLVNHHMLVQAGVESVAKEERTIGGQLGRPSGARFRTYERLQRYAEQVKGTLFENPQLSRAIEDIYTYPLRQVAIDILNRQLRSGISDEALAQRVLELREEGRLCIIHEEEELQEPRIICSLGLAVHEKENKA
ncbi:MAG: NgoFVII family restriction endonuclease [Desulfobacteraceae bacterium]|nr:MAG: NgoFVII family restriction endonuclease [Desulfobacteraceae bacterium]